VTPKPHRVPACAVLVLGILLALMATPLLAQRKRATAKFEPPDGKCMVFIGVGWKDELRDYQRRTEDVPAGTTFWYEFADAKCEYFWHNAKNNCAPGGSLLINNNFGNLTSGDLKPYLRGEYDEQIIALGRVIKQWGGPVFYVPGEFDHPDLQWKHRYTSLEFVKFFRHIHDLWDGLDVQNVAYVWHTCNESPQVHWDIYKRGDLMKPLDFWPGDKYVDWVGTSVYWKDQIQHLSLIASFARSKKKPLMVAECSFASPDGRVPRNYNEWHEPFFNLCERYGVKAIGYNAFPDTDQVGLPFRKSAFGFLPDDVVKGWTREMKKSVYLHASPELYERIGFGDGRGVEVVKPPSVAGNRTIGSGISLLNGKDHTGWMSFFKDADAQAEDEFDVTSQGVLSLRARHEGYLKTEKPYEDLS
jgi:hypothetical protein